MRFTDLHCDTLYSLNYFKDKGTLKHNDLCIDEEKLKKGGSLLQAFACFTDLGRWSDLPISQLEACADRSYKHVMDLMDLYERDAKDTSFILCKSAKDLPEKDAEGIYTILTVEEGGIINNDMNRLEHLYERGCRLITLTWNHDNCLASPNSKDSNLMALGLKSFGKTVVERMNELHMVVDVSHLSDGGFWDICDLQKSAGRPFVASHSCARAIMNHQRNMTDEMLKALGNLGGVVGLNYCGHFLQENTKSTVEAMVKHIRHMVNVAGIEAVGLGSDFDGFDEKSELADASQMPKLFDALEAAGFKNSEIEKIAYGNTIRVLKDLL